MIFIYSTVALCTLVVMDSTQKMMIELEKREKRRGR